MVGFFSTTENTADLENGRMHTHKIHTPQLPGAETLFISSNAYIKMKMYRIFLVQRNEKRHVDMLTETSVQYNVISWTHTSVPLF